MYARQLLKAAGQFVSLTISSVMALPSPVKAAKDWAIFFLSPANQTFSIIDHGAPNTNIDQKIEAFISQNTFNMTKIAGGSTTQFLTDLFQYDYENNFNDESIGLIKLYGTLNSTLDDMGAFVDELKNLCQDNYEEQTPNYWNILWALLVIMALICISGAGNKCCNRCMPSAQEREPLLAPPATPSKTIQTVELTILDEEEKEPTLTIHYDDTDYAILNNSLDTHAPSTARISSL